MVVVGELLASVTLKAVFGKLINLTFNTTWNEIALHLKFSKDLESMTVKLSFIQSFLEDAERQSSKQATVRHTLKRLKSAAYDLEDMLLLFESSTTNNKGQVLRLTGKARKGLVSCFKKLEMPHKMKRMSEAIEEILKLQNQFNFIGHTSSNNDEEVIKKRETFSDADGPVGRMEEKERIISMLQTDDSNCRIVFIYGFGGVGKTTLAQMVFNDDRTKQFFDIQAWVYVSIKFDIKTIGHSIISELDKSSGPADNTVQAIRDRLRTIVNGRRFLIVLDDLWEEDPDELEGVRRLLQGGKEGSKIIATTRSEKIAKLMNESSGIELGALSDNYCWQLFRAKAFPDGKVDTDKESIGRQIVKKCGGIPLAANSLGRLCGRTNEWEAIRDSDIWAQDGDDGPFKDTKVLPSLKLSYQYMAYHLKLCFAYCAVFPKGCYIEKSSLIQQWIVLGFVPLPDPPFTAQQAGEKYFEDLREMSFLQDIAGMSPTPFARYSKPRGVLFHMHDLVIDLARLVAGDEVIAFGTNRQQEPPANIDNCRYMLLSNLCESSPSDYWSIPSTARALHFNKCSIDQTSLKSFKRSVFLRVLDLSACSRVSDLLASIGKLRLLKFLNVSGMQIDQLPKSLSSLHGLQALNLSENTCLVELPSYIFEFVNLQYLDLHGCSKLKELPRDINKLKELLHLNISKCGSLQSLPEEFEKLLKLAFLDLSYCSQLQNLPSNFGGLENLSFLNLLHCEKLHALPEDFGKLRKLTSLDLSYCSELQNLPPNFGGLENLLFLNLMHCHKLQGLPEDFGNLRKLTSLDLSYCSQLQILPSYFGGLQNLSFLNLLHCHKLHGLPDSFTCLASMIHLNMSFCHQLKRLHSGSFKFMKKLLVLTLSGCTSLEVLPEFCENGAGCRKLEILELSDCANLAALPSSSTLLTELRCLNLSSCSRIQNFQGLCPRWKFGKLEYLNLTGVGAKAYFEAPGTSTGIVESSEDSINSRELELGILQQDITTQRLVCLKYLSVGGFTLFSEQGIASLVDLLTLPNFDVRAQPGGNHSNIMLLQQILDFTQHKLNIKCLENVVSPEEAEEVGLDRKQQLHVLSFEWSSSDTGSGSSVEDVQAKATNVLKHLRPHQNLQCLSIKGYVGTAFPEWINNINNVTLPNLVKIILSDLKGCNHIPELGNLPNLEELEINNMPLLCYVRIEQCKKLRRLTLVGLRENAIVLAFYNDSTETQVKEVELSDNSDNLQCVTGDEIAIHEVASCCDRGSLPLNKQAKRKSGVRARGFAVNVKGFLKALDCGMWRGTQQYTGDGNDSPAVTSRPDLVTPGPSNERREQAAVPTLDYFKIESCENLQLYPYFPMCEEFFIKDSSLRLGEMDDDRVPPFRRHLLDEMDDDQVPPFGMYRWESKFSEKKKWGSISRTFRRLKMQPYGSALLRQLLPLSKSSLQELEVDDIKDIVSDSSSWTSIVDEIIALEKLTISYELTEAEWGNILNKAYLGDISYVSTRQMCLFRARRPKRGSVTSNFSLLYQYLDYEIKQLIIQNLEQVERAKEVISEHHKLAQYRQLQSLSLMWSSSSSSTHGSRKEKDSAVLQNLQPPGNLKDLRIQGYRDVTVCPWMMDISSLLPNLVTVELSDMMHCDRIPSLGQVASMEVLRILNMPSVRKVGSDIYGGERPFKKLRELTIERMDNLEWITTLATDDDQSLRTSHGYEIFPNLQVLTIINCQRLRFVPAFPGSRRCNITECSGVLSSEQYIGSSKLTSWSMEIKNYTFSQDDFRFLKYSVNLEQLSFHSCFNLEALTYNIITSGHSLRKLEIVDCRDFSALQKWFGELTSLQDLTVHAANYQELLSESIRYLPLSALDKVVLKQCNFCESSTLQKDSPKRRAVFSFRRSGPHTVELYVENILTDDLGDGMLNMKNCTGFDFPRWMSSLKKTVELELSSVQIQHLHVMPSLTNLVKLELSNVKMRCVHLDQLQSLEELQISSLVSTWCDICCTEPLGNLRRIAVCNINNLVLGIQSDRQSTDENLFPSLQDLELHCCSKLRWEPSIPMSARYILSGSKGNAPVEDLCPYFEGIMGTSVPGSLSKMEIKHIDSLSSPSWERLAQLDIGELIIEYCPDEIPLTPSIRGWRSLQKLQILNCEKINELPEWLGEITSLRELKVDTYCMVILPACIQRLSGLQTLTLSKCGRILAGRCQPGGEDRKKLAQNLEVHIERNNPTPFYPTSSASTNAWRSLEPGQPSTRQWMYESDEEDD